MVSKQNIRAIRRTTMSAKQQSLEHHWEPLRNAMESGGPDAVITYIESQPAEDHIKVYNFAHRAFGGRDWKHGENGKNFDDYITVARAAIDKAIKMSGEAEDAERAKELKSIASMFSYNLTADLAECWPGDDQPRKPRHLEEGLRAAVDCTVWGPESGKPPGKQSMGWWAKGMHELSLKKFDDAVPSFRKSLDLAYEAAGKDESSLSTESTFGEILGEGYLGLAEQAAGDSAGKDRYARATDLFTKQTEIDNKKDDASFGLDQLKTVEELLKSRDEI